MRRFRRGLAGVGAGPASTALTTTSAPDGVLLAPGVAALVLVLWASALAGVAARFTLSREAH